MRADYEQYVALGNRGAREMGFADVGALWRSKYDMPPDDFAAEVDRLWSQVKPLYDELHCYVRARLAAHYGLDGFYGPPDAFVQMETGAGGRGGLLRQGALLTALSYPARTSPVQRGKWVLGHLLCQEPPPPPNPYWEMISAMHERSCRKEQAMLAPFVAAYGNRMR